MQDWPFTTPTQIVALLLMLIAGWAFGFASSSGGKRWRARYQDEQLARSQADTALKDANQRIRELEAERDRLRNAAGVVAPATTAAQPAWRGWFGWGRDNLARIRGVDTVREQQLNELGVKTYSEIENLTGDEEASLEKRLGLPSGTIASQHWREQASLLRAGSDDEHGRRYA
jgi:predicted flap endonuclease-1-like 5' DNA nuclease